MADTGKMKNGVVQRGKSWSYVVQAPDPATGKSKPRWKGGYRTRAEAAKARRAALHAMDRGTHVASNQLTLGQHMDQWLATRQKQRQSTIDSYAGLVRNYVHGHAIGNVKLQALTRPLLAGHLAHVHQAGGQGGKGVSVRTVRYLHAVLHKALSDAVRDGLLEVNPATDMELPAQVAAEKEAWTPEALRGFLAATTGHRLHPLWVLMAYSGMRRGEALALRWDSVDLDTGVVRVRRAVSGVGDARVYDAAPKTGEGRTITVPTVARQALSQWRKVQAAEQLAAGTAWDNALGYVFTMEDGRPVSPDYASKMFGRHVSAAGAPALSLHGLRHTAATLLLRDGVSVHLVARLLGHKDATMTLRVYAHAIPEDGAALADTLERIVAGGS